MTKPAQSPAIRLRGVRHNNLKNFDLDLPLRKLIVMTGVSGSGKSSLAFDTLFAEGQRRYIETFSPYARQFFDRMDKPQVDRIEGIPPAIAIEQRNTVRTTRSTVGTMTELCDYMKVLWPHLAQLHCRQCTKPVHREPPQMVWEKILAPDRFHTGPPAEAKPLEVLVTFDLPLSARLSLADSLALIAKQGYQRLLWQGDVARLDDIINQPNTRDSEATLTVVQDRLKTTSDNRARFIEACEQAFHFGKGKLTIFEVGEGGASARPAIRNPRFFSNRLHCATCDIEYREPSPALFSFNHPVGACPACKGFGRVIGIDYELAIPDGTKTLAQGCVKPWQVGHGLESQRDLMKFCKAKRIPTDVPFRELPQKLQDWVVNGDPGYGTDEEHQWPRAWYGVKGYFRWLESKAYKMHVRVLLSRYRTYTPCPNCHGRRLQPDSLLYRVGVPKMSSAPDAGFADPPFRALDPGSERLSRLARPAGEAAQEISLADFYQFPADQALRCIEQIAAQKTFANFDPIALALNEVRARLRYLVEVGLGYLTLDRPMRTLSGGETERVNLTTCLGTRLVNTLFVLDEPSVGLHARDTARLVRILQNLRDAGNTVVVVEHEANVMRAADQVVDLGPGSGDAGGKVVFQGSFAELGRSENSLTGQYVSGRKSIEPPPRRPTRASLRPRFSQTTSDVGFASGAYSLRDTTLPYGGREEAPPELRIVNAARNNLKNLTVEIPLTRFVCLTGVSGSGKTTLVREVLLPALQARLNAAVANSPSKASDRLDTSEGDDEDPLRPAGSTASVTGCEHVSDVVLVDQSPLGKTPRSTPLVYIGAFEDVRKIFAQAPLARQRGLNASAFSFNSVQGQCERCRGAGFEKIEMQFLSDVFIRCPECNGRRYRSHILEIELKAEGRKWNIAELLEATVDDALEFLSDFAHLPAGRRASAGLSLLREVGLGYLRLGQPINTLSGGESQRLKLVSHLAESAAASGQKAGVEDRNAAGSPARMASRPSTLFLFDEPTTGLHFDDVRVLLKVFQRLVSHGHSLLVIEHNLDVIKCADWVIDLGPEAGERGGEIVACGTPEELAASAASHTGQALKELGLPALARAMPPQPDMTVI